jgi:arylsulfatase A-like enzyme
MRQFNTRVISKLIILTAGITSFLGTGCVDRTDRTDRKPNFVIILTDDQGYNDLSCFGGTHVNTQNIDQMAKEGVRLTSFYVAAPVCSPSRAALMTGSYPKRIGMATGSTFIVLLPNDKVGLNPNEITIAEVLKEQGYETGMFGKWHLGDQPEFLPTRQGFDEFFGIPYSNDLDPFNPMHNLFPFDSIFAKWKFPPLPLYENEKVIETDPDQDYFTQRITERAVKFIEKHKKSPFFIYVAHPMPHTPLHASPSFMVNVSKDIKYKLAEEDGFIDYTTRNKLFSQVINEIDWSVGEILKALKRNRLDKNTLVVFLSDNGAAVGSAEPLRGKKGSTYEGGMRVPAIAWWPEHIEAGTEIDELLTAMDLLPTFARLADADIPHDRVIDGKDIWPVLSGQPEIRSPYDKFYYYKQNELMAIRSGQWKLHKLEGDSLELYDLTHDVSEKRNVKMDHPEIVQKLLKYLNDFDKELNDSINIRPHGVAK